MVGALLQTIILECLGYAPVAFNHGQPRQHHRQGDVFRRREARDQVKTLEHEADALAAHLRQLITGERGHVAPFKQVMACVGAVEQTQQVQ